MLKTSELEIKIIKAITDRRSHGPIRSSENYTNPYPSGGSILVAFFIQPRESFSSLKIMKFEIRENGVADIHLKTTKKVNGIRHNIPCNGVLIIEQAVVSGSNVSKEWFIFL